MLLNKSFKRILVKVWNKIKTIPFLLVCSFNIIKCLFVCLNVIQNTNKTTLLFETNECQQ